MVLFSNNNFQTCDMIMVTVKVYFMVEMTIDYHCHYLYNRMKNIIISVGEKKTREVKLCVVSNQYYCD